MIEIENIISKSILAGVAIGIGGFISLSCSNSIISALLFSVGLWSVVTFDLNLFTGKSAFLLDFKDLRRLILVLIFNLLSAFMFGILASLLDSSIIESADKLVQLKIDSSLFSVMIKSIITGFLMTLAVSSEQRSHNHIVLILAVMAFILSGCYHCIADAFYYGASSLTLPNIFSVSIRLLLVILFNFLGCTMYNIIVHRSIFNND